MGWVIRWNIVWRVGAALILNSVALFAVYVVNPMVWSFHERHYPWSMVLILIPPCLITLVLARIFRVPRTLLIGVIMALVTAEQAGLQFVGIAIAVAFCEYPVCEEVLAAPSLYAPMLSAIVWIVVAGHSAWQARRLRARSPKRIYLTGRRGAGKSTAARILQERLGARVIRITEPIYEIATRYFGMREKDRLLLQRLGDAFRAVDPAWLAKHAARVLEDGAVPGQVLVIEGVWTPEEAAWLNAHGWVGIRVAAPEEIRLARCAGEPPEADLHHTETSVDSLPVALEIRNCGTLEDFEDKILRAVTGLAGASLGRAAGQAGAGGRGGWGYGE